VTPSVLNNKLALAETRTRLKSILEKKPGLLAAAIKDAVWFDQAKSGIILAQADVPRLEREFELIARGLYFHEFGRRFEGKCTVMTNFVNFIGPEDRMREACRRTTKKLVGKEKKGWQWKGTNSEVFEYHVEDHNGIGMVVLRFFQGVEVYIGLRSSKRKHLDEVMTQWPSAEEIKAIRPKSKDRWNTLRKEFEEATNRDATLTRVAKIRTYPDLQVVSDPHHMIVLWQYMGEAKKVLDQMKAVGAENTFYLHGYALSEMAEFGLVEGADTRKFVELATRAGQELDSEAIRSFWDKRANELIQMGAEKPMVLWNHNPLASWIAMVLMAHETKRKSNAFEASCKVFEMLEFPPKGTDP
jgi:hypothetical protein